MNVESIMTRDPLVAQANASLDDVMRLMDTNDVRHVPIVEGETLIGVLSDRDLLTATGWRADSQGEGTDADQARSLIRGRPVVVSPDDSVVMAAVDLTSRAIGCLPVLEAGQLVGILTEVDLLKAYIEMGAEENAPERLHEPARKHMATTPATLVPTSTLAEAIELQAARRVGHLPVVEDGRLVGIISDRDLRKALGRDLDSGTEISELMEPDLLTLDPDEPLSRAAGLLLEGRVSALPVVEEGRLAGVLTLTDVLEHCITILRRPGS